MAIRVKCHCGKTAVFRDDMAGRKASCRTCQRALSVPHPSAPQASPGCPKCGAELARGARLCGKCGYVKRTDRSLLTAAASFLDAHSATIRPLLILAATLTASFLGTLLVVGVPMATVVKIAQRRAAEAEGAPAERTPRSPADEEADTASPAESSPFAETPEALNAPTSGLAESNADPFAVGTSGEWTGELERIGGLGGMSGALHFLVKLEAPVHSVTHLEGVVYDLRFAREVLDYTTTEERREETGDPASTHVAGDGVRLRGTCVSANNVRYRLAPVTAPLVRLYRVELTTAGDSAAELGHERPENTFRQPLDAYAVKGALRLPPLAGPDIALTGCFQGYDARTNLMTLGLGVTGRAVAVRFFNPALAHFATGETVTVTATPTGQVLPRTLGATVVQRPYFIGQTVSRPGKAEAPLVSEPPGPARVTARPPTGSPAGVPPASAGSPLNRKVRGSCLLIASEEGPVALYLDDRWHTITFPARFPTAVNWCCMDSQGACWMAGSGGVARLDGQRIEIHDSSLGLPEQPLSHVFEDSRGRLWVGSWGGGVARRERGRWQTFTTRDGLCHNDVNGCAEDRRGQVWVVGDGGATVFSERGVETRGAAAQLRMNFKSLDGDADGRLFLGAIGGLIVLHPDLTYRVLTTANGLPQQTPQATLVDSQGRVWLGTWGGGVVHLERDSFKLSSQLALPASGQVRRLVQDAAGVVWLGSTAGLWKLQDGRWQTVTTPAPATNIRVVATLSPEVAKQLAALTRQSTLVVADAGSSTPPTPGRATPPGAKSSGPEERPGPDSSKPEAAKDDVAKYLAANGDLRSDLRLEYTYNGIVTPQLGQQYAGQFLVLLSIRADGQWQFSGQLGMRGMGRSVALPLGEQTGRLTAEQRRELANTLAKQDLLGLPLRVNPERAILNEPNASTAAVKIRFRTKTYQATFRCDHLDQHNVRRTNTTGKTAFERYDRVCTAITSSTPVLAQLKQLLSRSN